MKIRKLQVNNYRSLREVFLDDISDLTILIGRNNSGKTNLLEAILAFFNEFDPTTKRNAGTMDEYVWFNKNWNNPVEFVFTFELDKIELAHLLPPEIYKQIEAEEKNRLEIKRAITGKPSSAVWHTQYVKVNDTFLIENEKYALETKKGETDFSQAILERISQRLNGRFRLISAARNPPALPTGTSARLTFLQSEVLSDLESLGRAKDGSAERLWIEEKVKKTCRDMSDLRTMGGRVTSREKGSSMYFPIEAAGGGYQEVIGLACQLLRVEKIAFGIEEPELHLHSESLRQLLSILKELSSEKQVFVTTHSTALVDQADLQDTWIVRKKKAETRLFRIQEPEALRNVLYELALRPSDIFYADGLIFVETHTERVVFQILTAKIGIDLEKLGISIIPTYGEESGRYRFPLWIDVSEKADIPCYFVLEKTAREQASTLDKKLVPEENLFLLKKGSVEEYYPTKRIIEALKREYGIDVSEREIDSKASKTQSIEQLLKSKGKDPTGWRVAVGTLVAESMSKNEIDDELKKIFQTITAKQQERQGSTNTTK